jgi:hypothetical protein
MVSASDCCLAAQKMPVLQCACLVHVMLVKMIRLIKIILLSAGVRPLTSACGKCMSTFLERRYAPT